MTIDKAIEDLTKLQQFCEKTNWKTHATAIRISIEALKYIKYRDGCPGINTRLLLPGETEE